MGEWLNPAAFWAAIASFVCQSITVVRIHLAGLKNHTTMEKLDHKSLGRELDLFHFDDISSGDVFWHHKGNIIYRIIENYIREVIFDNGYIEVKSPILIDQSLWGRSGHMDKYRDNIFMVGDSVMKPMNCPAHINIFNSNIVSYRDLPIRMAEFGRVFRNENSGSLNGLLRLKSFVQDDAHIFCSEDQIVGEVKNFCRILFEVYKKFGFEDVEIAFSDRPEKRIGSDEIWDLAENSLVLAMQDLGLEYSLNKGEGAFYGPKIEFILSDQLGRKWQCGVLQLDFNMAERLGAVYIDSSGSKKNPIMLHRAILGSLERFIAILLENYQGRLPFWLSPIQVSICSINNKVDEYCKEIFDILMKNNIRVRLDIYSDRIDKKILNVYDQKIPYAIVIGNKEMESRKVMIKNMRENSQELESIDNILMLLK